MPAFEYSALTQSGRKKTGIMEGDTARQVRQWLRENQLTPLSVQESNTKTGTTHSRTRLSTQDMALLTRQWATVIGAGTSIEEALNLSSQNNHSKRTRTMLLSLRSDVLEGRTLAQSMSRFPNAFPEMVRATISAGEHAGSLTKVLANLADHMEESHTTQSTLIKALLYPVFLSVFSLAIVALLLIYVVPEVVEVFDQVDQVLPWPTRFLIFFSDILKTWYAVIVGGVFALVVLFWYLMRINSFAFYIHNLLLRIPVIGSIIRGTNCAQFARTLSILINSDVSMLESLQIASMTVTNRPIRAAIHDATAKVREGSSLSDALRGHQMPPMLLHLIASGETSAQLGQMLQRAAAHQEQEINTKMAILLGLFEPILLIVMGSVVLFIVLAIMLPILELNQLVS